MDTIFMLEDDIINNQIPVDALHSTYQSSFDTLRGLVPEKTIHCPMEECKWKPKCYTNFNPHFNKNYMLSDIIIGSPIGWTSVVKYHERKDPKYGYLDNRPSWEAISNGNINDISFKISILHDDIMIMVCGYGYKESLKNIDFYLDVNYTNNIFHQNESYIPPSIDKRQYLPHRRYRGDECTNIYHIPQGNHILIASTNPNISKHHLNGITHVILF